MRKSGFPERNELVVCRILSLHTNSVDVEMIQYGKRGMVHVSEVAKRWVRDIREFLKEGQYVVCRVMKVDGQTVHLSIKRVQRNESDSKLGEFKRERKSEKMLEIAGKEMKKDLEESYNEVGHALQDEFGSLTKAFETVLKNPQLVKQKGIPEKWIKALTSIAEKSFVEKTYRVVGELSMHSYNPDGISVIKSLLAKAKEKNKNMEIKYISAPRYMLSVSGNNFKALESEMGSVGEWIASEMRKHKGEATFKIKE